MKRSFGVGDYVRYFGEVIAENDHIFVIDEINSDGNINISSPGAEIWNVDPRNVTMYLSGERK